MLTTNVIRETDKDYHLLKKSYPILKDQLYADTGLKLVQLPNAFKLQLVNESDESVFSSPFAYGLYFLILSALVSEQKNTPIPLETFAQQIIDATPDIHKNRDVIFKTVIQKLKNDKLIDIKTIDDKAVIIKKKDPAISFDKSPKEPLPPTTQIINYLLTHPSMNKRDHKHLWKKVTITDIRRQLEPYCNDNAGYDIYTNGDIIRLISKNDTYAFPKKNATHLVTTKHAQISSPKDQKASASYSAFDSLRQLVQSTKSVVYEEQFRIDDFNRYYTMELYLKTKKGNP